MAAGYPAILYQHIGTRRTRDLTTAKWNQLGDEVQAIEAALGATPNSGFATLADRVAALEGSVLGRQGNWSMVNLRVTTNETTPNTKVDITADAIAIEGYLATQVQETINMATVGAGGRDGGSIATVGWWFYYLIYNPTTNLVRGYASTSSDRNNIDLPTGYTYARRVGSGYVQAASQMHPHFQQDRWVRQPGVGIFADVTSASNGNIFPDTQNWVPETARLCSLALSYPGGNSFIYLRSGAPTVASPYGFLLVARANLGVSSDVPLWLSDSRNVYGRLAVDDVSTVTMAIYVRGYYDPV